MSKKPKKVSKTKQTKNEDGSINPAVEVKLYIGEFSEGEIE